MNELNDRVPGFAGAPFQNALPQGESTNQEESKEMMEMMDMISKFNRKQKRKVFKPSFSKGVKDTFKKKLLTVNP